MSNTNDLLKRPSIDTLPFNDKQKADLQRLYDSLDGIKAEIDELEKAESKIPSGTPRAMLSSRMGRPSLEIELRKLSLNLEKSLLENLNDPSTQSLKMLGDDMIEAINAVPSEYKNYHSGIKDMLYNLVIMAACFLAGFLPGMLYVGMGVWNFKQNDRFWLFKFEAQPPLKSTVSELFAIAEELFKPETVLADDKSKEQVETLTPIPLC